MTPLLEVRNASVRIGGATILQDASLTADRGELVAIVGPNGAGKSTLVRAAAGMQRMSDGAAHWDGTDVRSLRGRALARIRAFVPQRSRVPDGVRVREAVAIGRSGHLGPLRGPRTSDREAVEQAMTRCGVSAFADRMLSTLSGGELQRVQVAVALAQDAPALIADEPTAHLDLGGAAAMAILLRELAADGLAVVLVLHDLALAAAVADRVVVMSHGRTVAAGSGSEALSPERIEAVWSVRARLDLHSTGRTALLVDWLRSEERERLEATL